jgi:hypothetical protein
VGLLTSDHTVTRILLRLSQRGRGGIGAASWYSCNFSRREDTPEDTDAPHQNQRNRRSFITVEESVIAAAVEAAIAAISSQPLSPLRPQSTLTHRPEATEYERMSVASGGPAARRRFDADELLDWGLSAGSAATVASVCTARGGVGARGS